MSRPRINLIRMEEELSEVHLRLSGVTIENLAWQDFLTRYDRPGTFFYLDPPYYKTPCYKHNLELDDYVRLAKALSGVRGSFILSINDHPEMRKVFGGFALKPVKLGYSVAREKATIGSEILITNF